MALAAAGLSSTKRAVSSMMRRPSRTRLALASSRRQTLTSIGLQNFGDEIRRGSSLDERNPEDLFDEVPAGGFFEVVVSAFDQDVRLELLEQLVRRVLTENGDVINRFQSREDERPVTLPNQRTLGTFESFHRCVRIDADDQDVAETLRFFQ